MKTRYLLLIAVAVFALASCDKDDPQVTEFGKQTGFDDLDFFRSSIAWTDSTGTVQRHYGEVLYDNEPDHLYIGVDAYSEAEDMFLLWVAPGGVVEKSGSGLEYKMTDLSGKSQGSVTLAPSSEPAHVAVVTASAGTDLGVFSRLSFILNSAWPYNSAASKYQLGDIVKINGQNGICIREKRNGVSGMVMGITKKELYGNATGDDDESMMYTPWYTEFNGFVNKNHDWVNKYCPNKSEAVQLAKMLAVDWAFFVDCFADAGAGKLEKGTKYWTEEWDWKAAYSCRWAMDLSVPNTDGLEWFDITWRKPEKRAILRETF